jgi:hypothetical protein
MYKSLFVSNFINEKLTTPATCWWLGLTKEPRTGQYYFWI